MNIIDIYAKNHDTTRYQISKISGIAQTTLANFKNKSVDRLTVKTVMALALGTHTKPGDTLDELIKINSIQKDD